MISRILLPTDFSPVASNALDFALSLAKKTNSTLFLLHVNPLPVADINFPQESYHLFLDEVKVQSDQKLEELKNTKLIPSGVPFEISSTLGFISDEVIAFSEKHGIDLVIMGTTGASGLEELLIGSNTASVVSRSSVPVFVIPPSAKHADFKNILYASADIEPEFPAISRLLYFADLYQARITALHVRSANEPPIHADTHFFHRSQSGLPMDNIAVVSIEHAEVTEAISRYATDKNMDLIVMAKHNRNWFNRIFHRSLSKKMAYHARIPLLVLNLG